MSKKNNLFIILSGIFISNALIAEIIGVKIFSGEALLSISQANMKLFSDTALNFNLTAGALIWPLVFVTTDVINEYFGIEGVKKISYFTAALICYIFLVIWIATLLPPADFWLSVNKTDPEGNPFNINYAFQRLFTQGLGIIIGSVVAFLVGQILDVHVFHYIRKFTGKSRLWLRATGSTLASQLVDSFLVLFIAFYLLPGEGRWTWEMVISVGIVNYMYKFCMAILLTPLLYIAHYLIDRYMGEQILEPATG